MNRTPRHRVLATVALCATLIGGCADANNVSVFISGHVAPDNDCLWAVNNAYRGSSGVLDVSVRRTYTLAPKYNNSLVTRRSTGPLRANANDVIIDGAVVELRDGNGAALFPEFTAIGTTSVPSATNDGAGQAVGFLEVVPSTYGDALATRAGTGSGPTIFAAVKPFGKTTGNVDIETGEFLWPIRICNGCLLFCPTATDASTKICTPGQDEATPSTAKPPCP